MKTMLRLTLLLMTIGASVAAHGAEEAANGESGALIPFPPGPQQIATSIWVLVVFLVMLAVLYPTAWKGVLAGLKEREGRIRKDIADAEAARVK